MHVDPDMRNARAHDVSFHGMRLAMHGEAKEAPGPFWRPRVPGGSGVPKELYILIPFRMALEPKNMLRKSGHYNSSAVITSFVISNVFSILFMYLRLVADM